MFNGANERFYYVSDKDAEGASDYVTYIDNHFVLVLIFTLHVSFVKILETFVIINYNNIKYNI